MAEAISGLLFGDFSPKKSCQLASGVLRVRCESEVSYERLRLSGLQRNNATRAGAHLETTEKDELQMWDAHIDSIAHRWLLGIIIPRRKQARPGPMPHSRLIRASLMGLRAELRDRLRLATIRRGLRDRQRLS